MYAICNTTQDDVLNAVKEMVKKGYKFPITQVGQKPYRGADRDRSQAPELTERTHKHVVSLNAGTLHKKDCRIAKKTGINRVGASIVNVGATGLKLCKVCMS